jgi:hypothetical protein
VRVVALRGHIILAVFLIPSGDIFIGVLDLSLRPFEQARQA